MKSKPMGALFGILALVAIIAIAQPAYAANVQVTISKGASATGNATACGTTDCFNPSVVHANVGDTITWTNADTVGHTATSGTASGSYTNGTPGINYTAGVIWDSGLIKAGGTFKSPPLTTAGNYPYFCEVHPWMMGEIIVGTAAATSSPTATTPSGNQAVPEFGPVASLVLVIAIISVIAFTAKTRGLPK
ncbi:MAG: plastocyanin/azurin family copper-binding protein, partial [Nitrosotalea sp.]